MSDSTDEILGITSPSSSAPARAGSAGVNSPYYGWGGWLAFFCIVQIFVQPLIAIGFCVEDASAFGIDSRVDSFLVLEILGLVGMGVFGIITGIQLWRLRRGAVGIAKAYLVTALVWSILKAVLAFGMLEGRFQEAVGAEEMKGVVGTLIPFVIWFSYFSVSKRVKATFFDEDETIHIVPPGN
jgi:Protein of unknown function (DUF2569)